MHASGFNLPPINQRPQIQVPNSHPPHSSKSTSKGTPPIRALPPPPPQMIQGDNHAKKVISFQNNCLAYRGIR